MKCVMRQMKMSKLVASIHECTSKPPESNLDEWQRSQSSNAAFQKDHDICAAPVHPMR